MNPNLRKKYMIRLEELNKYFNPRVADQSDLNIHSAINCMIVGIGIIGISLTSTVEKGNVINNAVSLSGMSLTAAGISQKKGFLVSPAIITLLLASIMKIHGAAVYSKSFFTKNIYPIFKNQFNQA